MSLNLTKSLLNKQPFFAKQKGISMAFLLFVIIIVSLLAAALMRLNSDSNISNAHQVITTRAFFAAESGAQIQALLLFPINGSPATCADSTYNFNVSGLSNCRAVTSCSNISITTGTPPTISEYYDITSIGQCNVGQVMQATRTIQVRLRAL